jgi:hypothetical protein
MQSCFKQLITTTIQARINDMVIHNRPQNDHCLKARPREILDFNPISRLAMSTRNKKNSESKNYTITY